MLLRIRNRINHVILNRLLGIRYRWRRSPRLKKAIILAEAMCIKAGLIYNTRGRRSGAHAAPACMPDTGGDPRARAHRHV